MTIWVLIADNHETACAGVRLILASASDIKVIGEARNGVEVLQLVAKLQPDVLLLALGISRPCPMEIVEWVHANSHTVILILTAHDHDSCLGEMVSVGVMGYLTKREVQHELARAIRTVYNGQSVITDEQWARVANWRTSVKTRLDSLTKREREILCQIAHGHNNRDIASYLDISYKTVEYHVSNLLSKLGVDSRLKAAVWMRHHEPPVPLR